MFKGIYFKEYLRTTDSEYDPELYAKYLVK